MSETFSVNESSKKNNNLIKIPSMEDCIFNSKLFIDLDSTYEQSLTNSSDKEWDNSEDLDNIENESLLIKELIEELDSPTSCSLHDDSSLNYNKSIIPLVNKGYEFIPKGYKNNTDKSSGNKMIKIYNKYNILPENNFKVKHKSFKERKGDWFCKLCNNLNFAFRTKCNRCKAPKENDPKTSE